MMIQIGCIPHFYTSTSIPTIQEFARAKGAISTETTTPLANDAFPYHFCTSSSSSSVAITLFCPSSPYVQPHQTKYTKLATESPARTM